MIKTFRVFAPVFAAAVMLAACVTEPLPGHKLNIPQAVTDRVAAGVEYLRQGNPSEARRHFARALSMEPDNPSANNAMALLYGYEQDPKNEEKYFQRALDSDSHYAPALNNYGAMLYSQGRYKEAVEKFQRAVDDPNYEERGSAFSNLGLCYQALGQLDNAKKAFIRALRLKPDFQTASLELARIYYQQKRYDMAWNYFQQYQSRSRQPDAEALWLGIRLAASLNRKDDQSSYQLALQNLYPKSKEYRLWQEWKSSQETR